MLRRRRNKLKNLVNKDTAGQRGAGPVDPSKPFYHMQSACVLGAFAKKEVFLLRFLEILHIKAVRDTSHCCQTCQQIWNFFWDPSVPRTGGFMLLAQVLREPLEPQRARPLNPTAVVGISCPIARQVGFHKVLRSSFRMFVEMDTENEV